MSELDRYTEEVFARSATKAGSANLTGALGAQPGSLGTAMGGTNVKPISSDIDAVSEIETVHGSVNTYSIEPENRSARDGQELEEVALAQDKARLGNQIPDDSAVLPVNPGNAGLGSEIFR